jgi:hypothetical protein
MTTFGRSPLIHDLLKNLKVFKVLLRAIPFVNEEIPIQIKKPFLFPKPLRHGITPTQKMLFERRMVMDDQPPRNKKDDPRELTGVQRLLRRTTDDLRDTRKTLEGHAIPDRLSQVRKGLKNLFRRRDE